MVKERSSKALLPKTGTIPKVSQPPGQMSSQGTPSLSPSRFPHPHWFNWKYASSHVAICSQVLEQLQVNEAEGGGVDTNGSNVHAAVTETLSLELVARVGCTCASEGLLLETREL